MNYLFRYETLSGDIKPLPASPWLLPAVFIYGLAKLFRWLFPKQQRVSIAYPEKFDPVLYEEYKIRFNRLYGKYRRNEELTTQDYYSRDLVANPPWDEPGNNHIYPLDSRYW